MENKVFTLREISEWTKNGSNVIIPAIQRGLVWKPRQVELLWDSILRGFPIGSFMLSDVKDDPNKFYLMDGQQRFNAISLGYNQDENPKAVLWIDVAPALPNSSTRKFLVRVTTSAHPWGYGKDDQCTPLNTEQRRNALSSYNLDGSIYEKNFSLKATWPWFSEKPIPLSIVMGAAATDSPDKFYENIVNGLNNSTFEVRKKIRLGEKEKSYICGTLFRSIKSLEKKYCVHCNHLLLDVIMEEDKENIEEKSNLEILFERINVNGTRISNEDLYYSSIKAYWEDIRDINDKLAQQYMSPSKLAMLAFRLCLTDLWAPKLTDNISLNRIRHLSTDTVKRNDIQQLYSTHRLEKILSQIDTWLGINLDNENDKTPTILRTLIAHKCPDLYLLLMYWANLSLEPSKSFSLSPEQIRAIVFTIRWFSNKPNEVIKEIMVRSSREERLNMDVIRQAISKSMHDCTLLHIYTPDEVQDFFSIGDNPKWSPFGDDCGPWREFYWRISADYEYDLVQEMLLYAQRGYINKRFPNYDPARQDMWEGYNRPWDYDHIIAQNRINNKQGDFRRYDQIWLNTVGNIAAISYEANRSKHDSISEYREYQENSTDLLFDPSVENLTEYNITHNRDQSIKFAESAFARLVKIYGRVYKLISPAISEVSLSATLRERKKLFMHIAQNIPNAKIHFAAGDQNEYELCREQDWCREWISVGVIKNSFYVSFVWSARKDSDKKPVDLEIGIRRAPKSKMDHNLRSKLEGTELLSSYDCSQNEWWYAVKYGHNFPTSLKAEELIAELNRLKDCI